MQRRPSNSTAAFVVPRRRFPPDSISRRLRLHAQRVPPPHGRCRVATRYQCHHVLQLMRTFVARGLIHRRQFKFCFRSGFFRMLRWKLRRVFTLSGLHRRFRRRRLPFLSSWSTTACTCRPSSAARDFFPLFAFAYSNLFDPGAPQLRPRRIQMSKFLTCKCASQFPMHKGTPGIAAVTSDGKLPSFRAPLTSTGTEAMTAPAMPSLGIPAQRRLIPNRVQNPSETMLA